MDFDDIDTSEIPDFAPSPQWAKGPPSVEKHLNSFGDIYVPEISRETVINQLYLEAMDRTSRNQTARIRALELIAELKGWKDSSSDTKEENTDNLTPAEIGLIATEFEDSY